MRALVPGSGGRILIAASAGWQVSTGMLAVILMVYSALFVQPQPAVPPPDCSAPQYRQFDFWIGEWDVVTNQGASGASGAARKPASNIIQKAHKGCVLIENWDDGVGQTGQSFNIYDRTRQQWHQTWVDSNGGLHEYWGRLSDGNMVFTGQVPLGPGMRVAGHRTVRLTFFPLGPDKVRQFSETLNADGTWIVNYDLIYTRRAVAK